MTEPPDKHIRDRALDPAQSFIVQAPAGSGKTDLLTKRYLRLLATVEYPEQVLAITFTRKAAAEMRNRIINALMLVDPVSDSVKSPGATDAASLNPHEVHLLELARAVHEQARAKNWQLSRHPARLKIQTIDSLNTELTRQLPLLAKFGSQPQIAENKKALYEEAAYRCLLMLEDDNPDIAAHIATLLTHLDNNWARLRNLLVDMLARRDQWLTQLGGSSAKPDRQALEDALAHAVEHQLELLCQAIPQNLNDEITALAAYAASRLQQANAISDVANESAILRCANLIALPDASAKALPIWCGLAELLLTKTGDWRKQVNKNQGFPTDGKKEKDRIKRVLKNLAESDNKPDEQFRRYLHNTRSLPEPVYADRQWQVLEALLAVLPLAVAQLQVIFGERGEVDFTENALRAREALRDTQGDNLGNTLDDISDDATHNAIHRPTDLALRLDNRIAHILIDEFQDTSLSQYRLLENLIAGWQSDDGRTLFVVGDPMQSIYRFREAEVGLYLDARAHGVGDVVLEPLTLTANFRSRPAVVNWVNNAFSQVLPQAEAPAIGAVAYAAAHAQREKAQRDKSQQNKAQNHTSVTGVTVHPQLDKDHELEAEKIMAVLEQTRSANPRARIAILVRSRPHLAAILPTLRANGWRYQAVELERLGSQPVVQDLLALTRALFHAADRTAWLAVLRAPWCGLTLADLHSIATYTAADGSVELSVPEVLSTDAAIAQLSEPGQQRVQKTWQILLTALDNRRRRNVRDTVEAAWLALGGPATLVNRVELDDALAFLDILETCDEGGDLIEPAQLEQHLQQVFAPPDPLADDTLQVLTIHKAKGLEFDVVLAPGLGRPPRPESERLLLWQEHTRDYGKADLLLAPLSSSQGNDKDQIYTFLQQLEKERSQLEMGRLLYVLATRAREALHLFGHVGVRDTDDEWQLSSPAANSLLALLWPVVEPAWQEALTNFQPEDSEGDTDEPIEEAPHGPWRLPADWQMPDMPRPVNTQSETAFTTNDTQTALPEFSWAGEAARLSGTLVHRVLQQMADTDASHWNAERINQLTPLLEQWLAQRGIPLTEQQTAIARAKKILQQLPAKEKAQWLLFQPHTDTKSEYALDYWVDNTLKTAVLDRTFIDEKGTRWIVDYKTGGHEGGNVEAFLASERDRYRAQLEGYANLMKIREPERSLRVALYYPLLDKLIEWEPEV